MSNAPKLKKHSSSTPPSQPSQHLDDSFGVAASQTLPFSPPPLYNRDTRRAAFTAARAHDLAVAAAARDEPYFPPTVSSPSASEITEQTDYNATIRTPFRAPMPIGNSPVEPHINASLSDHISASTSLDLLSSNINIVDNSHAELRRNFDDAILISMIMG